jgi:Flp pilus assembly protein TadD
MKRRKQMRARPSGPSQPSLAAGLNEALRLYQSGDRIGGLRLYRQAAREMPGNPRLHLVVGTIALELEFLDETSISLRRATMLEPHSATGWINLTALAMRRGAACQAQSAARRSTLLSPLLSITWNNLAKAMALDDTNFDIEALTLRPPLLSPGDPQAYNVRQHFLLKRDRPHQAMNDAFRALILRPGDTVCRTNLAVALGAIGKETHAIWNYRRALVEQPDYAPGWYNLGNALERGGNDVGAVSSHSRAITLQPVNADYRFNQALCLLRNGQFQAGFEAMECRWGSAAQTTTWRDYGLPLWGGQPLSGQTVLVWAEQGLGDTLQFARYLRVIHQRGGRAQVAVQPELAKLFKRCPVVEAVHAWHTNTNQTASMDEPGPADFHLPMMSLPRLAGATVTSVPDPTPFRGLKSHKPMFQNRPDASCPVIDIGLVWAGNPNHKRDDERSLPLAMLAPLAEISGCRLHILQHGPARAQIDQCSFFEHLIVPAKTPDLLGAAALIQTMDLIITVDTALAHLAGTMGAPTWTLLPYLSDWRWLRDRSDSPWYPSMRLFRQDQERVWPPVIENVTQALSAFVNGSEPQSPRGVPITD